MTTAALPAPGLGGQAWHVTASAPIASGQRVPPGDATAPVHPAVMSPLLVWALRFSEDFAPDILAALAEHQRLRSRIAGPPHRARMGTAGAAAR
jgi:hypothetical protein